MYKDGSNALQISLKFPTTQIVDMGVVQTAEKIFQHLHHSNIFPVNI